MFSVVQGLYWRLYCGCCMCEWGQQERYKNCVHILTHAMCMRVGEEL